MWLMSASVLTLTRTRMNLIREFCAFLHPNMSVLMHRALYSEFATTRLAGVISESVVSDGLSGISASLSTSNSFNIASPLPQHARNRARLSTVTEGKIAGASSSYPDATPVRPSEPGFEMITPLLSRTSEYAPAAATKPGKPRRASHGASATNTNTPAAEEDLFARQKVVVPVRPAKSALSSMMAASNTTNPFSDLYSAIAGRGVSPALSMTVTVFFPFAREPAGKPMALSVRRDATVEEVLGFALWSYWEEGWLPRLDEDPNTPEDKLSAVGWVMKIAEEDGEVDEDFPRKSTLSIYEQ
jgi:target of rapamycin complex 2 subunit MAPKAP1